MSKKAIMLLKDDTTVQELSDQLQSLASEAKNRKKFIDKQLDDLVTDYNKSADKIWRELDAYLVFTGHLPPGGSKETSQGLQIDREAGVLYLTTPDPEESTSGLPKGLQELIRRFTE